MRRLAVGVVVLVAATLISPAGVGTAAPSGGTSVSAEPGSVPNQLLVGYRHGVAEAQRAEARGRANAQLVDRVVEPGAARAAVELVSFAGSDRSEAIRRFTSNPNVTFAEPNWIYTHDATLNDPYFTDGSLWGMSGDASTPANQYGSQAAEAWADGKTGSASVYVGIIDEGFQYAHPELVANAGNPEELAGNGVDDDGNGYVDDTYGWDFDGNNSSVYDGTQDDHGTHVAGTIGAKGGNGEGVAGVVWDVKLLSAKFLGRRGGTTANAVKAVDYFTNLKTRGLNIVATNNSWGGGGYSQALFDAITRAGTANILFVAAAGNDGNNIDATPSYPAGYPNPNVIAVAAIDENGGLASWSNYGATSVDLGAPGVGINSTLPYDSYGSYSGTSMATPHVTGAVALYAAANPTATAGAIKSALLTAAVTTTALSGKAVTGGRLDVVGALSGAVGNTPPPPPGSGTRTVTVEAGAKKKNNTTPVTVTWSGFGGTSVDVYRAGAQISTSNDGSLTENWRGTGDVAYRICETGSSTACADDSTTI